MPDYLFVLVVTIVMGLLPYIIGGLVSFVFWENVIDKSDHKILLRMGAVSALIGLSRALLEIYSR